MFDAEEVNLVRRPTTDARQLALGRPHCPLYLICLKPCCADGVRQLDVVEHLVEYISASVSSTFDVAASLSANVVKYWLNRIAICVTCNMYQTSTSITHLRASALTGSGVCSTILNHPRCKCNVGRGDHLLSIVVLKI